VGESPASVLYSVTGRHGITLLKISSHFSEKSMIYFYDSTGRILHKSLLTDRIELDNADAGLYFYRIVDSDGESDSGNILVR
jgi:hypothetical protein